MRKIIVLAVTLIYIWSLVGCGNIGRGEEIVGSGEAVTNNIPTSEEGLEETDSTVEEEVEEIHRFTITNGNNGKQLEFSRLSTNTGFLEVMDKYERLELDKAENQMKRVGYSYCLRLYDVEDNLLHTITLYEHDIEIDGVYYTDMENGTSNELFLAMDALFEEENMPLASTSVLCGKQIDSLDGVTMEVTYATDKGANLAFTNNTDKTIQFGDDYSLQMLKDGEWYQVDKIIEDAAFNDIAYNVPLGGTNAWRVKWTYFHGILPKGNYRIVKTVMDFRGTGDYTNYLLAAEFEVE